MKKLLFVMLLGLFATAVFAQTKTEVKPADLSKPVTDYIQKNYAGYTIDKAFKVDSKGVITWDVIVSKDKMKDKLEFDNNGKFLKQIAMGEKPAAKSESTTPQHQHTNTPAQPAKK